MTQLAYPEKATTLSTMPKSVPCDRSGLADYRRDRDSTGKDEPLAIFRARHLGDIEKVVRWAAKEGVGIIPVSSAPPRRRGDTVPGHERCVVLDLSRMNHLIHADRRDRIAIVEPGVTFGAIDQALAPHGLRAFRPLKPRAGKSVIASYLEREPLISPNQYWDTGDPFGGTAIMLGSGTLTLTGGAATPGTLEEKLARGDRQMSPIGPTNLDLVRVVQGSQGSLGIMAWAAIYCEPLPMVEQAFFASAEALGPLIAFARDIMFRGLGNALFIVDRVQFGLMVAKDRSQFDALLETLPQWILFTRIAAGQKGSEQDYAAEEKLAWQCSDLQNCAAVHGLSLQGSLAGIPAQTFGEGLHESEPGFYRDRLAGAHRDIFFLQQLPLAESFVHIVRSRLARPGLDGIPVGAYIQPTLQGVSAHIEFTVPFDPTQSEILRDLDAALFDAATACSDAGGFFSRPYHAWASFAFAKDPGIAPLLAMTKSTLDPAGVMNPGRIPYGV